VTMADLQRIGIGAVEVLAMIAESLGLAGAAEPVTLDAMLGRFDPDRLPRAPWIVTDPAASPHRRP
jgi:glutamyl-tRNA synthetase